MMEILWSFTFFFLFSILEKKEREASIYQLKNLKATSYKV